MTGRRGPSRSGADDAQVAVPVDRAGSRSAARSAPQGAPGSGHPAGGRGDPGQGGTPAESVDLLRAAARRLLRLSLSPFQLDAFAWYLEELLRWNARHNLTAIVDPGGIAVKHFLDSLTLIPLLGADPSGRLIDIGTGAGFPGLPLRIACPALRLTLVEATGKKADFCRHVVEGLGLKGVDILHARAEDVARQPGQREAYDVAVARAVASLPILIEYLLPLVRLKGRVLAQKGENAPAEVQQASRALELLGGRLIQIHSVVLPGVADARYIVEIEKAAATPPAYPRRPGLAARRTLFP